MIILYYQRHEWILILSIHEKYYLEMMELVYLILKLLHDIISDDGMMKIDFCEMLELNLGYEILTITKSMLPYI